ncbi:WD40-repeat-containing domain protein [Globomyces pollinis-pini]|nr:WD40-repeat-containing domain protein [Globomyces pollinis-pini]
MRKPISTVSCSEVVFDVTFHPSKNLLAAGLIDGNLECYDLNDTSTKLLFSSKHHTDSCRSVDFNSTGDAIYTGSKDRSLQLIHLESQKVILRKQKAHSQPINKVKALSESLVATGDDAGCVKIWDLRSRKLAYRYHENSDFISDMAFVEDKNTLVVTSGGGCLSVFDIRKKNPVAVSANQDDELLSVTMMRNNTKAVVGTQSGNILFFSWNDWGDCTDRFPGHPQSVSSVIKASETTLYTGSGDGIIRAVGIFPNCLIGSVGDHGNDLPIESMSLSFDGKKIATCSIEETVKIWDSDLSHLDNDAFGDGDDDTDINEDEEMESDDADSDDEPEARVKKQPKKTKVSFGKEKEISSGASFFQDLD